MTWKKTPRRESGKEPSRRATIPQPPSHHRININPGFAGAAVRGRHDFRIGAFAASAAYIATQWLGDYRSALAAAMFSGPSLANFR
jgi:hypothetical protein